MIILVFGASHTGKTQLSQKLLETLHIPYMSIDHLKMGLIRSGQTTLSVFDDSKLTDYLWPIVREMIKTAIENEQSMIVEGCYIPFNFRDDFSDEYLKQLVEVCLVFSESYIMNQFSVIQKHANVIEQRMDNSYLNSKKLIQENDYNQQMCLTHGCHCILIDQKYNLEEITQEIIGRVNQKEV